MKYLISISYDGSKYNGLQKLKNGLTVQGELEKVLSKCNTSPVKVISSGRTDKGVHALNQKCSFTLDKNIDPYKLKGYINRSTSRFLYVNSCITLEDESFHARFSVKSKTYKYIINTNGYDPIVENYQYNYNKQLNVQLMQKASKKLLGTHNFKAFVIGPHKTCKSTIHSIDIEKLEGKVILHINGTAFYTYMVRNIVQVLILIGAEKIKDFELDTMLKQASKTFEYPPTPPGGLYLEDVEY